VLKTDIIGFLYCKKLCELEENKQDETGYRGDWGVEVIGEGRGREQKRLRVQSKGVGHWGNRKKIFERDTEDNRKNRTVRRER
jgi:hypothetical protein